MGPYQILLDCGLRDMALLPSDLPPADLVLCSHAHADHARGLLSLHRAFPQLPIYATEVTTQLLALNWTTERSQVPLFAQALPWRSPVEFQDGLTAELFPAGHLPGAAVILLTYTPRGSQARPYTVLYTGDFFLSNSRLVEGLRLEELRGLEPDVLIVEGSYGTARYPHRRQQENQVAERISQALSAERNSEGQVGHQSVLLPLPTLGLGQELLMLLRSHHLFTGRDVDIWVDGTIAAGCDAYLELLPHFPASVQNFARHQSLFWDERVRPRVRRLPSDQRETVGNTPCIVLTDLTSDWNAFFQPDTPWLVLLPQHLADPFLLPNSDQLTMETYLLAQHCDGPSTTQLIHNLRPQHVIFVHGNPNYLADLTGLEELHNRYHLHSPSAGSLVELPIGETFLQPAPPETTYEGELAELGTVVTFTLPDAITADSRWRGLADTGLIEARWQGQDLVLRGLTQRELLNQISDRISLSTDGTLKDSCATCRHCRGQRCWNPGSPLFNFKVPPEGYCPAYEPTPPDEKPVLDHPFPDQIEEN
ncbi:MBL fold metallo-hydrolase [Myxacorys almedinensis A]|uniref:MBL fold metallo-hydrolase n=2 Tax=Myxacorys TaxID=2056239 RepID=A0A8J7Z2P7_9CYAN|nr:MBL fold metallo-hydrolase [Myxacorys almedinensis]NDJ18937.1 MBL fold metallo-hydrolase [Myxacorys almedinensis A]